MSYKMFHFVFSLIQADNLEIKKSHYTNVLDEKKTQMILYLHTQIQRKRTISGKIYFLLVILGIYLHCAF